MRLALMALAATAPLLGAGAAQAASVEIKDAAARVVVIPEARNDIKVEILKANPRLPLQVRQVGSKTIVDGNLRRKFRGCRGAGLDGRVFFHGIADLAVGELPYVVVRTPRDVDVEAGGAVFGSVGRAQNVDLEIAGCGDWTIANVTDRLVVHSAGSGDVRAGRAGEAEISLAGSGDIHTQAIARALDVSVAGSGSVSAAQAGGRLKAKIAGSGDVVIAGGRVSQMEASIAGSGDIRFGGQAQKLDANIVGSGDIYAAKVSGDIDRSVIGSGKVHVGP